MSKDARVSTLSYWSSVTIYSGPKSYLVENDFFSGFLGVIIYKCYFCDLSGMFSDWYIAGNSMSGLENAHYPKTTAVIFTYLWALCRYVYCQNIDASMNKCMFIIVVILLSKNVPLTI